LAVNLPAPLRERLSREDASDSNNWLTNELLRITAMLLEPRFLYVLFVAAVSTGKVSILSATTILREDSGTQKQQFIQTLVVYAHKCDVIFASCNRGASNLFLYVCLSRITLYLFMFWAKVE